jgi:hypothetical protein
MAHFVTRDRIRAAAVAVAAVFMVSSNSVNGPRVATAAAPAQPGVTDPATWAFAIWGLIFLLALVAATDHLLPRTRDRPLLRATGWLLAATFLLTGVWPIAVVAGQLTLAQLLLSAMWVLLAIGYVRIARTSALTIPDRWLVAFPVAVFFGWVTAANAVSLFSRLTDVGLVAPRGLGDLVGVGLLVGAGLVAAWFVRIGQRGPGQLWASYALTIVWAIVGILANQPGLASLGALGALIAAVPVVITAVAGRVGPGGPVRSTAGPTPA